MNQSLLSEKSNDVDYVDDVVNYANNFNLRYHDEDQPNSSTLTRMMFLSIMTFFFICFHLEQIIVGIIFKDDGDCTDSDSIIINITFGCICLLCTIYLFVLSTKTFYNLTNYNNTITMMKVVWVLYSITIMIGGILAVNCILTANHCRNDIILNSLRIMIGVSIFVVFGIPILHLLTKYVEKIRN